MRRTAKIEVGTQSMRIYDYNDEFYYHVRRFLSKELSKHELVPVERSNKMEKKITAVFASKTKDNRELRITVNVMKEFLAFMRYAGYNPSRIEVVELPISPGVDVKFAFKEPWGDPQEHQVPWVQYQNAPGSIKINTLQTGKGKTFCALKTMVDMGKRTIITLSPKYLQTWLNAFDKFFDFEMGDVVIVQGTEGVIKTLGLIEQGKINPKIIVLSLQTLQFFMKAYEHLEELPYNVDDMWRIFDCGLRIQDEGHEAIHAIYKTLMYGNVAKTLILSATLEGDTQFINRIYELTYPMKDRFSGTGYDKYIEAIAYLYGMDCQANQVKWKGRMGYSHIKLEQSILKRKDTLERYLELIDSALKYYYLKVREPGMKCLIFCSTVEMCLVLTMYLKNRYPQLHIDKYTSIDPPENYMDPDIVCSTPKSCGTGVDIPGLRTTLTPVAVGASQLNNQMLGRLRKMSGPWASVTPTFVYFVCEDIKPHVQYHRKRMEIFENKTVSMKTVRSGVSF